MEKTIRQRITTIKDIKEEHGLSVSQIMDIMSEQGGYVSQNTLNKLFREGSENKKFNYHSIAPVYEALISVYGDDYTSDDVGTLKRLLLERSRQIDSLIMQIEDIREDIKEQKLIYEDRKHAYERTIAILEAQIEQLNDQNNGYREAISRKDAALARILDAFLPKG